MTVKWPKFNRKVHHWGSILCALPLIVVLVTGMLLLLKKDFHWVQPETASSVAGAPSIQMSTILSAAQSVPEANIRSWEDIDRLDVRPGKGIIKIRGVNHWEIQINHSTAEVLQVAYRRSDVIEALHDGSFFHEYAKYGLFLPSAIILFVLWLTGLYLFITTHFAKQKSRRKKSRSSHS